MSETMIERVATALEKGFKDQIGCGCVYCDLGLVPEATESGPAHYHGHGLTGYSPCLREQTMQSLASEGQAMGLYGKP